MFNVLSVLILFSDSGKGWLFIGWSLQVHIKSVTDKDTWNEVPYQNPLDSLFDIEQRSKSYV